MAKYIAITNLGLVGAGFEDPSTQPAGRLSWWATCGLIGILARRRNCPGRR
jgi:hypothetical protein